MNHRPAVLTSSEVIRHLKADPIRPTVHNHSLNSSSSPLTMSNNKPPRKVISSSALKGDSLGSFHQQSTLHPTKISQPQRSHSNDSLDDDCTPYRYTLVSRLPTPTSTQFQSLTFGPQLPTYHYHDCEASSPTDTCSDSSDILPPLSPCYQPEWIYRRLKPSEDNAQDLPIDNNFWTSIIQPRSKADRSVPILGHTNSRHQSRRRGPSVSSIPSVTSASTASTSSLTKANLPKAKSILTRTSSASTKNSLGKSVKFVDTPTIHYAYDNYDNYHDAPDEKELPSPPSPPVLPSDPPGNKLPARIRQLIWPSRTNQKKHAHPVISTPLALGSVQSLGNKSDNGSIRSIRSANSTRSEKLHRRPSGPFLRSATSLDSFHPLKSSTNNQNKFRTFLGKIVT
jgi:hypothetical protein